MKPEPLDIRRTRVLFLGEKPLALHCLRLLASMPNVEIVGVATRRSRDLWYGENEVVTECRRLGLPLIARDKLGCCACDLIISVLYPFIVDGDVLAQAGRGAFNLHEASLPRWRGCNGCSHAILAGDSEYATTLHEMTEDLDAGAIVAERRFAIGAAETARELYERTSAASSELANQWLPRIVAGDYTLTPQDPCASAFRNARNSLACLKRVPMEAPLSEALRFARALDFVPWEPAFIDTPSGVFYLYVEGSPGRTHARSAARLPARPDTRLSDLPWPDLQHAVIDGLPRPIEVCRKSIYLDRYPLQGMSATECHA